MLATDQHAAILNDLIRINNDRIAGYETALASLSAGEKVIAELFEKLRTQSVKFREELIFRVAGLGGEVAGDSTFSGKIFRSWMELKTSVLGTNQKTIVESCLWGEDAWQKAYEAVLHTESHLPDESRRLIDTQLNAGRTAATLLLHCQKVLSPS